MKNGRKNKRSGYYFYQKESAKNFHNKNRIQGGLFHLLCCSEDLEQGPRFEEQATTKKKKKKKKSQKTDIKNKNREIPKKEYETQSQ